MLKYLLIVLLIPITAQAYLLGEIPTDSTDFITLENQPKNYDIFNPPEIEVSLFADFSDSSKGRFVGVIWDRESLDAVIARTGQEYPEVSGMNKYVTFILEQPDKPVVYRPALSNGDVDPTASKTVITMGWKYARLVVAGNPVDQCTQNDYYTDSGTTKNQLLGVIKQFDNLVSNGDNAGKVLRSVADLYGKVDEVKNELSVLKNIVSDTNTTTLQD